MTKEEMIAAARDWFYRRYGAKASTQHIGWDDLADFALEQNARLTAEVEELRKILDFFGIEVLPDGSSKFTPNTMRKFRQAQHDKEYDALKTEVDVLRKTLADLNKALTG